MASSTNNNNNNMKGFYKQKKNNSITKKHTPKTSLNKPNLISPKINITGGPVRDEDDDEKEAVLKQFDMNMAYGPCLGMSRLDRWERANKLGMNPPRDVETLLNLPQARLHCLWEGRV